MLHSVNRMKADSEVMEFAFETAYDQKGCNCYGKGVAKNRSEEKEPPHTYFWLDRYSIGAVAYAPFRRESSMETEGATPMDEKFLENVLSHLDESVFVLDRNGSIIYVNEYLLAHGIMTKRDVLNINSNVLFQTGQSDINIWKLVQEKKQPVTALQTINAHTISSTYMVTQIPIMDDKGEVAMSVGVMRDMSVLEEKFLNVSNAKSHVYQQMIPIAPLPQGWVAKPLFKSQVMSELFQMADAVATSDATVLVLGESGVGKEVLSSYLHKASGRRDKKMVAINCAALNENLLESELFGYEKGAFTGAATAGKKGLIAEADGSTLFLDEVDSLSLPLQAKLLRVLETHEVRPIGGRQNIKVNFRVIAATNANLKEKVKRHQFREDLFYRLNILPITIPPLRERKEDIPVLADNFLNNFGKKYGRKKRLSSKAMDTLVEYHWPGNVRELRNFIERLVLITDVTALEIKEIPDIFFSQQPVPESPSAGAARPSHVSLRSGVSLKRQVADLERELIEQAVVQYGSLSKAADALGTTKSTLIRKRER